MIGDLNPRNNAARARFRESVRARAGVPARSLERRVAGEPAAGIGGHRHVGIDRACTTQQVVRGVRRGSGTGRSGDCDPCR